MSVVMLFHDYSFFWHQKFFTIFRSMDMKYSLGLGKIAGIQISVHWTFLILIAWIFISHYRQGHDAQQALLGVVFIFGLFLCVTLHELGHALTAKRYHIKTKSITLLPIGGVAQMERMPEKPAQELWVALAGPAVNVVLAILLYTFLSLSDSFPQTLTAEVLENLKGVGFWLNLFFANMVLAVFNLIPAFPMDGGRVLRALLSFAYSREKATRIAAGIGQVLAIGFVFLGFYANIWLIFIGVFIYLGAGAEAFYETTKSALTGHSIRDAMMQQFTTLRPDDSLDKVVQILLDGQEQEFIVIENGQVVGILTRRELIRGLAEHGKQALISMVMRRDFLTLHPGMTLTEVYQLLATNACAVAPVIDNGQLIGVVDRENINELIMINDALKQ